ncbi:MAG TPA: FGGY family carbohydrate kinase [Chitinophagaceae bacterium]
MSTKLVIAVFDIGKTNKKLFLFDEDYRVVYEHTERLAETTDEDGDPCEDITSLRRFVINSLDKVFAKKQFAVKAINFSAYGASFVLVDGQGNPVTPLYNYLKPYPSALQKKFYDTYGGEAEFSSRCASPILGSLNSGMQLYRLKHERPQVFQKVKYALHLPQYLAYLISGKAYSDITSIGCHTNLWDFHTNSYHAWVTEEGISRVLPPVAPHNEVNTATFGENSFLVGSGLHDSSAALIPYLMSFHEPFVLISSGTWCISLNPFNDSPLTQEELSQDCLCYLQFKGRPVKASRLFAGQEHEDAVKRIATHFNQQPSFYKHIAFDAAMVAELEQKDDHSFTDFASRDLNSFANSVEAYHQLMMDLVRKQAASTWLVLIGASVKRIFVDGGFSNNALYMNLLATTFPGIEIYAASMTQATALGAALALHGLWTKKQLPADIIQLNYYGSLYEKITGYSPVGD